MKKKKGGEEDGPSRDTRLFWQTGATRTVRLSRFRWLPGLFFFI